MDCVFCRIINREEDAYVVYEDEYVIAILDKYPVSRGHTLVMPKRHYRDLMEIPNDELCRVITVTKLIATAVKEGLGAPGVRVVQNNGSEAGQVIFHIHFHVIPMGGHVGGRHVLTREEGYEVSTVLRSTINKLRGGVQ
ncbi:HIT family protein [Vulcanisaeta thermophila]|uniref:HIT family protein n=1 Tax=Vulcanisaeta thermophila TaxID=867917 RepID=UPI0008538227|nr:HIT family protein [Vulcanisaeta thermophila]